MILTETLYTARSLLREAMERLSQAGIESARADAELLLAEALSIPRHEVILEPGRELNTEQAEQYRAWVERRSQREPAAYILGRKEFWSLDFKVTPAVLVPRPETELIIECLLAHVAESIPRAEVRVLDLCTGPGTLAVTVAKELPKAHAVGVDISSEALKVAVENARTHDVQDRVEWVQADLKEAWQFAEAVAFDYVLSNPPYIASKDIDRLMPEVRDYEPKLALDGGPEGLDFYRIIISEAGRCIRPGGALILEVEPASVSTVLQWLEEASALFEAPILTPDYSGYDRIVTAVRRQNG